MECPPKGLWRNADFLKLWTAQTISKFGSHIGGAALEFTAILNLHATPAQMGLLSAVGSAPVLLFGLVAGVWVDRMRRRPILVAADLGRAALLATVFLAAVLGYLRMEQLYVVAALVGVLTVFYGVADQSALPAIVPRAQLVEANSKLGASESLAEVSGTAAGGSLVQWLTAPFAILVDSFSFVVSALCIGLIRKPEPPPAPPGQREGVGREIAAGLRVVWNEPLLRSLALNSAALSFFGGFFATLYSLFLIRELGLTPALVGFSIAAGGAGALLGAALAGPVTRRFGIGPAIIGSRLLAAVAGFGLPLAHGPKGVVLTIVMATQVATDVPFAISFINEASLRQAVIPDRYLGRASASIDFLVRGVGPAGALLGGALAHLVGMRLTLLTAVIGFLLASLWLLATPLRALRDLPAVEDGVASI